LHHYRLVKLAVGEVKILERFGVPYRGYYRLQSPGGRFEMGGKTEIVYTDFFRSDYY